MSTGTAFQPLLASMLHDGSSFEAGDPRPDVRTVVLCSGG
jgi:hypothetical protein